MRRFVSGALTGLGAAIALAAPALAGPTVTVRVEGENGTLLDSTRVTLPDTDTIACGAGGPHTVADALELATGGNWDRQEFARTIMGETHPGSPDYWAEWIGSSTGYAPGARGVCEDVLKEGDEALMYATLFVTPATHFPLRLEGLPGAVEAGKPVTITVVAYETQDFMTVTRVPVAGATVSGGGASAVTGADGTAVLSFAQPGEAVVRASKPGSVISTGVRVTVAAPGTAPPPVTPGGRVPDTTAPTARIAGLRDGQVFSRRRAPRTLRGTVSADPSGLKSVRLSVLRRKGGKCWAFDGDSERFERHRCGGSSSFRIGDSADWSYLLPNRLPRGRYTIRVVAIDNAGNDSVTRTRIRVR